MVGSTMMLLYRLAFVVAVTSLGSCEGSADVQPIPQPEPCRELFAQCKLPEGPLGVCNEAPCAAGQSAPCLRCVSQH